MIPVKHKSFFLLLLTASALALLFLSFWAVRQNSLKPGQGFMISNVSVSVDFEDHHFLAGTASSFAYGARQVCVRFDYSRLEANSPVEVFWDWDGKRVQAETYDLPAPSGTRMYCLLKEDGSPLPRGIYTVTIQCLDEVMPQFHFEIH